MALAIDNTALVVASRGSIFTAPANTALPAGGIMAFAQVMSGLATTITGWTRIGNTSRENLPEFSIEAGDTTSLGTWDTERVRTVYGASSVSWTLHPSQLDAETVKWVANGWGTTDDAVIPASGWQFTAAYVIVVFDGTMVSGLYLPNNDSIMTGLPSLAVDGFSEMEVSNTLNPAATAAIPANVDGRSGLLKVFKPVAYSAGP